MRPVTVGLLIDILKTIPSEALVWTSDWRGDRIFDRSDFCGPFFLYEKDGEVRLYIDNGEATHPDIDKHSDDLFRLGEAQKRVEAIKNER